MNDAAPVRFPQPAENIGGDPYGFDEARVPQDTRVASVTPGTYSINR